jgi:hypothetical protein
MNVGGADGVPLAARGGDRETAQQDLEEDFRTLDYRLAFTVASTIVRVLPRDHNTRAPPPHIRNGSDCGPKIGGRCYRRFRADCVAKV